MTAGPREPHIRTTGTEGHSAVFSLLKQGRVHSALSTGSLGPILSAESRIYFGAMLTYGEYQEKESSFGREKEPKKA